MCKNGNPYLLHLQMSFKQNHGVYMDVKCYQKVDHTSYVF